MPSHPSFGALMDCVSLSLVRTRAAHRIPANFVAALNSVDEVWAPTAASATVLRESGVTRPLRVVPPVVDTGEGDPGRDQQRPPPLSLSFTNAVQVCVRHTSQLRSSLQLFLRV